MYPTPVLASTLDPKTQLIQRPLIQKASSFYWLMVLETKVWARDILVATRYHSFRSSQLSETRNTCVYSNLRVVG